MGYFVREWKQLFLIIQFILLSHSFSSVQSVAAASEWPLGLPDEYTTAWINITYRGRNGTLVAEKSQSGRFGKGGKIASVSGVVVHVKSIRNGTINHYGCDPIINDVPQENWIALIKRGLCDFDLKLEHAYAKKAVGMVVYDRDDSDSLQDMKLSAYTIPGVFTYKSRGERIANISDSGTRVEMHITVGEVCSRPYSGINRTSVLFVSISFIVLMIISLAWLVFYYVQRFRYLHAKDRLAQRLCNAAKKALAKIPTRSIKQTDKEVSGEGECCAVCIEFYKTGDMLRTLPCRHEFHKCCVDPWLLDHRTCPMCKMDILKYYGYVFTGSQESILHLDLEDGGLNSSDSAETNTPSHENQLSPQFIHDSTSPQIDSSLASLDESSPGVGPPFPSSQSDSGGELVRKPSLISLTVVATPNGCVTSVATGKCVSPQLSSLSNTATSDNSISSHSKLALTQSSSSPDDVSHRPVNSRSPFLPQSNDRVQLDREQKMSSNFQNSSANMSRSSSANMVSESGNPTDSYSIKSKSLSKIDERIGEGTYTAQDEKEKSLGKRQSGLSELCEETD